MDRERATALFRILQETLTNVARHAKATHVRVRLTKYDHTVALEVRDNGRGIDESRVFGRQSLGMLGMKERAFLLGGELVIESTPGAGTTVIVRIPGGERRPAPMIQILIVDDHAILRRGLKEILEREFPDVSIGGAGTAEQALTQLDSEKWDLVILDITMPGRSGVDVLRHLKELRPKLPVLVLSMHPEDQYGKRVLKAGASGYMNKESAPEELIKAVRKLLSGGR